VQPTEWQHVARSDQRHDDPTPPMLSCAGAGSWWPGVVVSVLTWKGSTWESLAQETSAISTTESAETRIIDLFMARTVVDAAGQFNHTAPCAVKRAGLRSDCSPDPLHGRGGRSGTKGGNGVAVGAGVALVAGFGVATCACAPAKKATKPTRTHTLRNAILDRIRVLVAGCRG
jgi:hypothetical protein